MMSSCPTGFFCTGACFERTPYVSVIAGVLVLTGSGIMCGSNFEGLRRTKNIFEDRFYPISGPKVLQIIGVVYAVLTMIFGVANVVSGALVTGQSRQKFYSSKRALSSGRKSSCFLLVVTYFITLAWLILFIAFAVPATLWSMLHSVCRHETDYWRSINADKDETQFTYTFNLTHYGLYRRPLDTSLYNEYVNSPSAFTQLCQEVSTVGPLFVIALFASLLVLIGLNCFVACLSSAIVRLDYAPEVERYRRFLTTPMTDRSNLEAYSLHPLINHTPVGLQVGFDAHSTPFTMSEARSNTMLPTITYQLPGGGTATVVDQSQTMPYAHHMQNYQMHPDYQTNR